MPLNVASAKRLRLHQAKWLDAFIERVIILEKLALRKVEREAMVVEQIEISRKAEAQLDYFVLEEFLTNIYAKHPQVRYVEFDVDAMGGLHFFNSFTQVLDENKKPITDEATLASLYEEGQFAMYASSLYVFRKQIHDIMNIILK